MELIGARFGSWEVVADLGNRFPGRNRHVLVECGCGEQRPVRLTELRYGRSTQCRRCADNDRQGRPVTISKKHA